VKKPAQFWVKINNLATRRAEDAVWLAAWGAEMLRVHLHNIECDLDSRARRAKILAVTGGIPSEVVKLVNAMHRSDDPDAVAEAYTARISSISSITSGPLGRALVIIEETHIADDYLAMNELLRENIGQDLSGIGPDMLAMGLISGWNPTAYHVRRSALGALIVALIET